MQPLPKTAYRQTKHTPLQALDVLKDLLQGSQSTEEKAKTLLELQGSKISLESGDETEDDDSSLALDPWDESQEIETIRFKQMRQDEGPIDPLSLRRARPTWAQPRVHNQPQFGLRPEPSPALEMLPLDHREDSYWVPLSYVPEVRYHGRVEPNQEAIEHGPGKMLPQGNVPISKYEAVAGGSKCVMLPIRGIIALGSCLWTATWSVGGSCARLFKSTNENSQGQAGRSPEKPNGNNPRRSGMSQAMAVEPPRRALASASRPELVKVAKPVPARENRFETSLKKALFQETLHISTTILEPGWNVTGIGSGSLPLFSGWNARMDEYELRPQGRFVAQTKKAFNDFLEKVELGGELQVLGSGGGLSSTGLPALLKRSFTSYEWMGMWRGSEGRRIRIPRVVSDHTGLDGTLNPDEKPLVDDHDRLQTLENELLGLDKYMGGDSEYLTVITYSDGFVGAISLFKAELPDEHQITQLNRVAMIPDVPREICSILREEIKPNRYVVGRNNRKLKCYTRGDLPPLQIVKISNESDPWKSCGGGWRKALRVPNLNAEYSSGEGLLATIPHMIGLLHLQHLNLTELYSSPALAFVTPLDVNEICQVRRGVLLNEKPQGSSHIGGNTRITVLFPRDSAWAQEQFVWA
ncbi:hypothetical protein FSARC_4291 [Fusarium sarcochroum]|uniref:Uncharacterized protein n=1 Tax=Fusarium sarcochroum TaxID=1208366 RepID=A0A8H4XBI2_9HYPO|nr:hypothetical protein FSARC_4291 [Fusarium sarcochroum]